MKAIQITTLCALSLLVGGCVNISDEAVSEFGEALGRGFGEITKDAQTLAFSSSWYYRVHGKWPADRTELTKFIDQMQAPLNLSRFDTVEFETKEDGSLECSYSVVSLNGNMNGTLLISEKEAKEMDFGFPDFNDPHFQIQPPRDEAHIQTELSTPFARASLTT